jgi:hypothetical protein
MPTSTTGTAKLQREDWRRCLWIGKYGKERRRRWEAWNYNRGKEAGRKSIDEAEKKGITGKKGTHKKQKNQRKQLDFGETDIESSEPLPEYEMYVLGDEQLYPTKFDDLPRGEPNYYVMSRHMESIFVKRVQ